MTAFVRSWCWLESEISPLSNYPEFSGKLAGKVVMTN